jgi:hypothetical protein
LFHNLSKIVTASHILTIEAGSTQTIGTGGLFNLKGAADNLLSIVPSSSANWNLVANGAGRMKYVGISYCNVSGSGTVLATECQDNGNNNDYVQFRRLFATSFLSNNVLATIHYDETTLLLTTIDIAHFSPYILSIAIKDAVNSWTTTTNETGSQTINIPAEFYMTDTEKGPELINIRLGFDTVLD